MKIIHITNLILIVLFLAGICIIEDVMVSNALKDVQEKCYTIERMIEEKDSLKDMEMVMEVENLEYNWTEDEKILCFMVNHKSMQEIGQEIAKLKMYIESDDADGAKVSTQSIKMYCHSYLHFMGANLHNIL